MAGDAAIYPFYRANIHERRWLACFVRAFPLIFGFAFGALVLLGAFRYQLLLLVLCATTNICMWLWISSTATIGMIGALAARAELDVDVGALKAAKGPAQASEAKAGQSGADSAAGSSRRRFTAEVEGADGSDTVSHIIIYPNYKEDEEMLAETLASLAESVGSEKFRVVLAMEARENGALEKGERLKARYASSFSHIFITRHPANLVEKHLDGSIDEEVAGKASNLKWAVAQAYEDMQRSGSVREEDMVLTVADADCIFHPRYFDYISREACKIPLEIRRRTMWQAPQLPFRNYYASPVPSRVWGYIASCYEFGGVSGLFIGGHHMLFSGYTVPLKLAVEAEAWDGDVMAEDHHCFLKCLFYTIWAGGPIAQVKGVLLPVKATSVVSEQGYWRTWVERWHQAKRHAQGVAELPYAMLVILDAISSMPLRFYTWAKVYAMAKVLTRLLCVHILPLTQLLAMTVMSVYWFYNKRMVPMCPDRIWLAPMSSNQLLCGFAGAWALMWPMVVPLSLVVVANVLFIWVTFLRPKRGGAKNFWERQDAGIQATCGSELLTVIMLTCFDCMVMLGPVMFFYGFVAMCIAYWNVCLQGNRMEYITAAKAASITGSSPVYGSTGTGSPPHGEAAPAA